MPEFGSSSPRNPETAFEPRDVNVRVIGIAAIGVIVWLGLVPFILSLGYSGATRDAFKSPTVTPPEPRLQVDPRSDLAELRAAKQAELTGYGWVDQPHGIVHIPIGAAMQRIAERGLPDWPGKSAPAPAQTPP